MAVFGARPAARPIEGSTEGSERSTFFRSLRSLLVSKDVIPESRAISQACCE